ncbi:cytidylate kinase-like family protein [Microbispora sp. ATCC PTA-5024]|uniref:cytidylate kinase-like family protein n=1 Tax=Microbispora sp. ATCC PTA-5024 TaxID=316330 RepID=UPI0003DCC745|nr:cytidylate kinase-like family protein [Microbispora sp. ATCC PTA-5024]ETK33890.1 cytidylate kinase [Microbispora sp. ATCC PTA-5024]
MQVVTLSATYGTGGSVIGPAVAERLGVPFLDRAIPGAVAQDLGVTLEEALAHDDRAERGLARLLLGMTRLPSVTWGGVEAHLPPSAPLTPEEFTQRTEQVIRETARTTGGVFLGRAGAIVLADHPGALHVRLDGPLRRRVLQTAAFSGVDEREARRVVCANDRARAAYVRQFYRADPADPGLYHLVLDSTVVPVPTCVELIVTASVSLG